MGGIITSTMAGRSLLTRFKEGHNLSSKDFVREIQQDPEAASEICAQSGNTLLHYICCGGDAPLKVVSALLTAYPEAAATCDHDGNIPLVGAISNGCGKQVVELLLQANPEGIRWTSGGHTLLHFAACNNAGLDVVQLLLDTWPEATKERDDEGNTPLHFAAACQAAPDVVCALVDVYPEAAQLTGRMQRLPLNLCLLCKAHPQSYKIIEAAFPGAMYGHSVVPDHFNSGFGVCMDSCKGCERCDGMCHYCRGSILPAHSSSNDCPLRLADEAAGHKRGNEFKLKNLWR